MRFKTVCLLPQELAELAGAQERRCSRLGRFIDALLDWTLFTILRVDDPTGDDPRWRTCEETLLEEALLEEARE